jgi:alpha-L-rhamnosidase
MKNYISLLLMLIASCFMSMEAGVSLTALQVESQNNPIGVWNTNPQFSWQIQSTAKDVVQTAYQIIVATSPKGLDNENGNDVVWNSGKVTSDKSVDIIYKGKNLTSATTYYWKVNVWTNKGEAKGPSTAMDDDTAQTKRMDSQMDWMRRQLRL